MLMWPAVTHGQPCEPPTTVAFGDPGNRLVFSTDGQHAREATLEQIDFLTRLKWSLGQLIPSLVDNEVSIYLYNIQGSNFLADYKHIDRTELVGFFIACEEGGEYVAVPGSVSPLPSEREGGVVEDDHQEDGLYLGITVRPRGTTPDVTLKGDWLAFR